jgi:Tol biopolymer transport system component
MIAWSPNGREIWFRSFDPNEWGAIYAMNLNGRQRVLMRVPGHATLYDVAQDGRILLRTDSRELGIFGVGPDQTQERDLSCLDMSTLTGISDDGKVIAAGVSGESGGPKGSVFLRKTDGSPCIRLGDGAPFAFSPDGKWVSAYTSLNTRTRRYVLLPTGAGDEREIAIPKLKNLNMVFGWSRDNTTFFVFGPDLHGGWRNYLWNAASGDVKPIGPDGVTDSLGKISPDRQKLLAQDGERRWWIYPVDGSEAHPVPGLSPHDVPKGWRADGHSLYIVTHHDTNKTLPISILDIATGKTTPWKEIHPSRPVEQITNVSITPDGRAYAYNFLLKVSDLYIAEGAQ